jgi:hypothetical protein
MRQAGDSFELRETLTLYGQLIFAKPITASIASYRIRPVCASDDAFGES